MLHIGKNAECKQKYVGKKEKTISSQIWYFLKSLTTFALNEKLKTGNTID